MEGSSESFPFSKKRETSVGNQLKWPSHGLQFIVPLHQPLPLGHSFGAGYHIKVAGRGLVNVNLTFSLMLSCIWKPLSTQFNEGQAP